MRSNTQQIAVGLRCRDMAIVQELVEHFQYRLVRYLIYLLGRRDGIEDLVQETWLRVLERGASYDGLARFEPWLFTVAHNIAIDGTRRRRSISLSSDESEHRARSREFEVSPAPSPFALAARTEDAEKLAASLETLELEHREALVLRFQEDLSLQEISAIVGAPVSTVASRLYRGLAKLRGQLKGTNRDI